MAGASGGTENNPNIIDLTAAQDTNDKKRNRVKRETVAAFAVGGASAPPEVVDLTADD